MSDDKTNNRINYRSPIQIGAYLVIGYLCGLWLSEFFAPDFNYTVWTNIWVYFWLFCWPVGLIVRLIFWLSWWVMLIVAAIVIIVFVAWAFSSLNDGVREWLREIRLRRMRRKIQRNRS